MKKTVIIVAASVFLGIAVIVATQLYSLMQTKKGALQITSSPESKVYLNNIYLGQTPLCKCEGSSALSSGTYVVRLASSDKSIPEYREKIVITQGVLTVVDRKFTSNSLSEGSVISLNPLADMNTTQLSILAIPEGLSVFLDNKEIGKAPLLFANPKQGDHVVELVKKGYIDKKLHVRIVKGYKLVVRAYLGIDQSVATEASSSAAANVSLPSAKVVILDTPTGFLRVRAESSINASETARVNPGETYSLTGQQDGWFEIVLSDGKTGWISNQYAKKQ